MKRFSAIAIIALFALLFFYFGMPVLNYGFIQLPAVLLVLCFIGLTATANIRYANNKTTVKRTAATRPLLWVMLALVAYITIIPFFNSPLFRAGAYRKLIGTVKNGTDMQHHITPLNINKVRVVDEELAHLLGEKILGSDPALGSKTELGDFTVQKVDGELYWVAPLLHSGFFKWLNNREGTQGYVMVSATNERDVKLVEGYKGQKMRIKYQPGAYFFSEIERYLYFNGYAATGLADYNFEIDDEGYPYWVVTKYEKTIGFSGNNTTGVLVIDAQTGAIADYGLNDIPAWVDRIQPQAFVEEQMNDWGEYVHGFWNFSNENKLQITEGMTLVYGSNDRSYWYTGLTSVGADESAVGFVLVDTKTKQATYYNQAGATEYAAQQSAQGKVQEKGYHASLPVPYTINGIPTYVMTLKDEGGLVKMYAMVSIADYTIVGVGNTMQETLMAYKNVYNMSGNRINPAQQAKKKELEGTVDRIQSDVKNGNSFYYFTVSGHEKIFIGSSQISNALPVTRAGDSIKITYDSDTDAVIDISSFENWSVKGANKEN